MVHVRDMAKAIGWSLTRPATLGHSITVNVGSNDENFTVSEIADVVSEQCKVPVRYVGESNADSRSYRVRFDKWCDLAPSDQPEWGISRSVEELRSRLVGDSSLVDACDRGNGKRLTRLRDLRSRNILSSQLRWN